MKERHSVLVVASEFPPLAGTNAQRTLNFIRHLPDLGWECTVVARAVEDMVLIDNSELALVPSSVNIVRVKNPDPFAVRRRRLGRGPRDVSAGGQDDPGQGRNGGGASAPERSVGRLAKDFVSTLAHEAVKYLWYVPDGQRPWADAAVRRAAQLCQERAFDIIFTSCPTYSTLVAGLKLKRRTGLPWVADFSDLWTTRPGREFKSRWHALRERRLEAQVVKEADRLVVASPAFEREMCGRYGEWLRDKIISITMGYDAKKLEGLDGVGKSGEDAGRVVFVYTGAMDATESPAPFIEALGRLRARRPELVRKVVAKFIGYTQDEMPRLRALVQRWDLGETVLFLGAKSHRECLRQQRQADVLLLLSAPIHKDTLRGKSYEYMASGKAILALIPEQGVQAELLSGAGTAWVVEHGDVERTEAVIEDLLESRAYGAVSPDWDYIRGFEIQSLAERLSEVMVNMLPPAGASGVSGVSGEDTDNL